MRWVSGNKFFDQPISGFPDQNLAADSIGFNAARDIHGSAHNSVFNTHFGSDIPHNYRSGVNPYTHLKGRVSLLCNFSIQFHKSILHGKSTGDRSCRIIILFLGHTKNRQDRIPNELIYQSIIV